MNSQFKIGQTYCSKHRPKGINFNGEYYVVIQEESDIKRLALMVINTNKNYASGAIIEPEYPEMDLEKVQIKASDLIDEEITIMEINFNDFVASKAIRIIGIDEVIKFTCVGYDLKANVEYEIEFSSFRLMGNLYYDFHNKEKFVKS
jgi:hypothetical protein